jgi:hypothetical protein
MKPLIKRKGILCMLIARMITCTQFKRDYVHAIDMWDANPRVGWVRWVEIWVKRFHGGGRLRANLHCKTTTKSISPLLVCRLGPEKWSLSKWT